MGIEEIKLRTNAAVDSVKANSAAREEKVGNVDFSKARQAISCQPLLG